MARSFIYDRPLDARILPDAERSKHEFRCDTLIKIKEEVDNTPMDTETKSSDEALVANPSGCHDNSTKQETKSKDIESIESDHQSPTDTCKLKSNKKRRSQTYVSAQRNTRFLSSSRLAVSYARQNTATNFSPPKTTQNKNEEKNISIMDQMTCLETNSSTTCEKCGMVFASKKLLLGHLRYYTADGVNVCSICNMKFNRSHQLLRHRRNAHSSQSQKRAQLFMCEFCGDGFERQASLTVHIMHIHSEQSVKSYGERASAHNKSTKKISEEVTAGNSKYIQKYLAVNNSKDDQMIVNDHLDSTTNSSVTVENSYNEKSSVETLMPVPQGNAKSPTLHQTQSSDGDSTEKSVGLEGHQQEIIRDTCPSKVRVSRKKRGLQVMRKRADRRRRAQRSRQTSSEMISKIQMKLQRYLGDHLISSIPDEVNDLSNDNSLRTTDHHADQIQDMETTNVLRRITRAAPKIPMSNGSTSSTTHIAPNQDYEFPSSAGSSIQVDSTTSAVSQQVGSVLLHQVSGNLTDTKRNVDGGGLTGKDDNVDIDVINSDDFGKTCESVVVTCKDEKTNSGSYESITPRVAASCSNISVTDSLSLNCYTATSLPKCNTLSGNGMRELRIVLERLEHASYPLTYNSPLKLSVQNQCCKVKIEKPHCDPNDQQFSDKMSIWKEPKRNHDVTESEPTTALDSIPSWNRASNNYYLRSIALKNTKQPCARLRQGYRCLLCAEFFHHNSSAVSHYLSAHIKLGVLQCCLCYSNFTTSRKLRLHLAKNVNLFARNPCMKFCVDSKADSRTSNFYCLRSSKYNHKPESNNQDSPVDQFSVAQKSVEHGSNNTLGRNRRYGAKNNTAPLSDVSPVPISKEGINSIDHKAAGKPVVVLAKINKKIHKYFKCAVCDCIFSKSSRFKHHQLAVHADVKCRKSLKCRDVSKVKPLARLKRYDNRQKSYTYFDKNAQCANEKYKNSHSKDMQTHDKLCRNQSNTRSKFKFSQVDLMNKYSVRQNKVGNYTKGLYSYRCHICKLRCCCRTSLRLHQKHYSSKGNYICDKCGLPFSRKQTLDMHIKVAHNLKYTVSDKVKCEICNERFFNRKFFRIHLAHFHNLKYFECSVCKIRFNSYRSLKNHRRYHSANSNSICGTCGQSFKFRYLLKYHEAQVHTRGGLQAYKHFCTMCTCAFIDKLLLQAHVGHVHNSDHEVESATIDNQRNELLENVKVEIEDIALEPDVETNNLTMHTRRISEDVVDKTLKTFPTNEYKCGICKQAFSDPHAILNHEWEFSNEGTCICDICNRRFMTDALLNVHKVKHYQKTMNRQNVCYICNEHFSEEEDLKMHGLHLHGPEFLKTEDLEDDDNHSRNSSNSRIEDYDDDDLSRTSVDDTGDTVGLGASDKEDDNGMILLFERTTDQGTLGLERGHQNEDTYFCIFCYTNFNSASLLKDHMKKHAYRAYYTNSSKYLCLICKRKFCTNDVLRAHVIHCHSFRQGKGEFSERQTLQDYVSDESVHLDTLSCDEIKSSISDDDETENFGTHPLLNHGHQNQPSHFEGILPKEENQLCDFANDVADIQQNLADCTPLPNQITARVDDSPQDSDLLENNDGDYTEPINSASTQEELDIFIVKLKDVSGLDKYACTICTQISQSAEHSKNHFAAVHVKNGTYLCNVCKVKFSLMSELRDHLIDHGRIAKFYECCNQNFRAVMDFVHHKLLHDEKVPSVTNNSPRESDREANIEETGNLCKSRITDESFIDIKIIRKHLNPCIKSSGLKCNFCRAPFENLNSLKEHEMSCHERKNRTTLQNPLCRRSNDDKTIESSMHDHFVSNHLGAEKTTDILSPALISGNNSSQTGLHKITRLTVKPFANLIQNLKTHGGINDHQEDRMDKQGPMINRQSECGSKQGSEASKLNNITSTMNPKQSISNLGKAIPLLKDSVGSSPIAIVPPVRSTTQLSQSDFQVSNIISCNTIGNQSLFHLPIQDTNNVVPNVFNVRCQRDGSGKSILPALQLPSSSSFGGSSLAQSIKNNYQNRVVSKQSGEKSSFIDGEVGTPMTSIPISSSASGKSAIYLCVSPVTTSSGGTTKSTVTSNGSGQKSQPNDAHDKIPLSYVPVSSTSNVRPTYYLCLQRTSDTSFRVTHQPVSLDDSNPHSSRNIHARETSSIVMKKGLNSSMNTNYTADNQGIITNAVSNCSHDNASNNSSSKLYSNHSNGRTVPTIVPSASSATNGALPTFHINSPPGTHTAMNNNSANREFTLKNYFLRCGFCNQTFKEKEKLIKHVALHKTENQCPACGLIFLNQVALQQHLPEHECSKCTKCNRISFFTDTVINPSTRSGIGTRRFCLACNSLLPPPMRKFAPSKISERRVLKCGICSNTFGTMSEMTVHFKQMHASFQCGICEGKFTKKMTLHSHMQIHESNSRDISQCGICNKYFMNPSDLAAHVLSHKVTAAGK